jgi:hypothetical protein
MSSLQLFRARLLVTYSGGWFERIRGWACGCESCTRDFRLASWVWFSRKSQP